MKEGTMTGEVKSMRKRRMVSLAEGGGMREIPIELANLSQRAKEVQIAAELVQAQADALLAAARNATDAPLFKGADALSCEVALDEVRFALQAIARGFSAGLQRDPHRAGLRGAAGSPGCREGHVRAMSLIDKILERFGVPPPRPAAPQEPTVYEMGGGWGDAIQWWRKPDKVLGWKRRPPNVDDILLSPMESGKTRYRFTKVRRPGHPSDMFFADVEFDGYEGSD